MLRHTSSETAVAMAGVRLTRIFKFWPLIWKLIFATALVASVVAFSIVKADAHSFWLQRIRLSNELWPRRVQLQVKGFQLIDGQYVVNVARDDDFELHVKASIEDGHEAPRKLIFAID